MKLILFGGAEIGLRQVETELKQIESVIKRLKPKQVFHIPFARTRATEIEWSGDWFHRHIHLKGIMYLNAKNKKDISKAKYPLVFMSGGSNKLNLMKELKSNPKLMKLVKSASCIIGESAGATVLGSYFRASRIKGKIKMAKGLNIIKDAVVKAHYTQRKRQKELTEDMEKSGAKYGIAIDSLTAMEFNVGEFPKKYKKIGKGKILIKKRQGASR